MASIMSVCPIRVICASAPKNPKRLTDRVNEKRKHFEQVRNMNLRRVKDDIKHIANREMEYARSTLSSLLPFKVTVNEEAIKDLQDKMPIKVEWEDDPVIDPEIVEDEPEKTQ
jgi:hypothetical protein